MEEKPWYNVFAPKKGKSAQPASSRKAIDAANPVDDINTKDLPIGQVSVDSNINFGNIVGELLGTFNSVNPKYPIQYLDLIDILSIINPDMSQAISNIVLLGNTGHSIELEGGDIEQAASALNSFSAKVYPRSAGIDGLINTLLSQICRSGALSMEWVPDLDLRKGIRKVQVVPVKTIRWVYNPDPNVTDFYPVQVTNTHVLPVALNQSTYIHYAMDSLDDSPYPIPPFIAALENIYIQRDMISNLRYISKKMGLLGFMNLMVSAPRQLPGESETAYKSRCDAYLQQIATRVKDNFKDGIAIGFKDAQEFHHTSVTGDARGAAELSKFNEELVFSGLKSDPSMQGRTYSTTETYASVVFEKMLAQHGNYQRLVKRSLEYGARLHLALLGINVNTLSYRFNPGKSANILAETQAVGQKVLNARMMYEDGIISQQQRASMLGYDAPDQLEPRQPDTLPAISTGTDPRSSGSSSNKLKMSWNKAKDGYEFDRPLIVVPSGFGR